MAYYPRVADSVLSELLGGVGAVLIEGPRGSGKTSKGRYSEFWKQNPPQAIIEIKANA